MFPRWNRPANHHFPKRSCWRSFRGLSPSATCLSCHVESSERSHLSAVRDPVPREMRGLHKGEDRSARTSSTVEPCAGSEHSWRMLEILQVTLGVWVARCPRCFEARCTIGGRVGTEEMGSSSQRTTGLVTPYSQQESPLHIFSPPTPARWTVFSGTITAGSPGGWSAVAA